MANKKVSFEVVRDENAEPAKRFILRVKEGGKSVYAPRFPFLENALTSIAGILKEEYPNQKNVKIEINY